MIWEGIHKRKFPRANYRCRIVFSLGGEHEEIDTYTENIGCGGICITLDKPVDLFQNVKLKLHLEDGQEEISSEATIVWVVRRHGTKDGENDAFDTGIEFRFLKEKEVLRLQKIVENTLDSET